MELALLTHTLAGTALLAFGASALNQLWEREHDAKMRRTENRPLPSGRLQPETVLVFGGVCSAVGLGYLALAVNLGRPGLACNHSHIALGLAGRNIERAALAGQL